MPRPIVFTEEMKQQARKDFEEILNDLKMSDGKLRYNKSYEYEANRITVSLSIEAYKKMIALVTDFADEVAWHGTVSRLSDREFIVEDVFVYPQEVTGSSVQTDQNEYTKWLYELDDEVFNKIRMHGHSHVNMGVSPSGIDDKHRQQILDQMEQDMFYVFMIFNKSLSIYTLVYDMGSNVLYEDKDIDVKLYHGEGIVVLLKLSITPWGSRLGNTVCDVLYIIILYLPEYIAVYEYPSASSYIYEDYRSKR